MNEKVNAPIPRPKRPEPRSFDDLGREIEHMARELNTTRSTVANADPVPAEKFVDLGQKLADALLESAEQILNEAQNHRKQTEEFVASLRQDIDRKNLEHQNLMQRLSDFSTTLLDANKRFHGNPVK